MFSRVFFSSLFSTSLLWFCTLSFITFFGGAFYKWKLGAFSLLSNFNKVWGPRHVMCLRMAKIVLWKFWRLKVETIRWCFCYLMPPWMKPLVIAQLGCFLSLHPPPCQPKKKKWNSMKLVPKYNWALKLLMGWVQLNLCLSFEIGVGWVDSNELLSILGVWNWCYGWINWTID